MAAPTSVEEYLAALPRESRAALEKLRKTIKAAAPEATETISYQMPAFKDHGRFLVSYVRETQAQRRDGLESGSVSYPMRFSFGIEQQTFYAFAGQTRTAVVPVVRFTLF